jgi:hypothetical protein
MNMTVFWEVVRCSLVDIHRRFREAYCIHHQGEAVSSSEMPVNIYQAIQRRIAEDHLQTEL